MKVFTKLGLAFLVLLITSSMLLAQTSIQDVDPNPQSSWTMPASDALFDLQFSWPVGVGGGEAGIETDGNYIYTTKWNGTGEFYRYGMDGTYIEVITVAGASAVRDLAYNGTYFYGAAASATVFELDLANATKLGQFTAPAAIRAIAYNEDDDVFYGNNWSEPIQVFGPTGASQGSFPTGPGAASIYGMAYDNYCDGQYLWVYAQPGTTPATQNVIFQIALPSGVETGVSFDVATVITPVTGIAGGLCISNELVTDAWTIMGMMQNEFIWGLELCSSSTPPAAFFDDFENGISNWVVTGDWGLTDTYSYSPSNSLTDSPGGNYLPNLETYATMATGVDLSDPSILSANVNWWMIMDIENGNFDYLYVEVSDDDFATFVEIASFFGEGMLDPWMEYSYPLGSFLGSNNVKVRFHFSSDGGYEVDGCYIDDFSITTSDIDNAPPEIYFEEPFGYEGSYDEYVVEAEILDATGIASAEVIYTVDGEPQPNITGVNVGGDNWEFTIPQQMAGYQVDFEINAVDSSPNANETTTETASYIAGNYISYDNAQVDFYTSIAAPGGTAVIFTIADASQLATALIRNYTDQSQPPNDEMLVHIWSDGGNGPGVDIIDPILMMPEANLVNTRAFTRVDLRPYAAELGNISGNIFVGFTVPSGIVLTTITQPGIGNHSFNSLDGSSWSSLSDDYHYRIITGDPLTSTNEVNQTSATKLYPNPAKDVVHITSDLDIMSVKVFNQIGQLIVSEQISTKLYQVNTSHYKSGLYFFQIETKEGITSKRVVIE